MTFDITRLKTMRAKILLARDTALAKSRQFEAEKEKQATSFHARRALALEEYAATLQDATDEIALLRKKKVARCAGPAPCTREEAYSYGAEIEMPKDAVQPWYDHFQSNGWLVSGKTPMKDWQAALRNGKRTWERDKAKYGTTALQTTGQAEPEGWQEFLKKCYPNEKRKEYRYAQSFVKNDFAEWVKKEGGRP